MIANGDEVMKMFYKFAHTCEFLNIFELYTVVVLYDVCVCAQSLGHVLLFVTPWTVAHQAPLSMEFSRQEYWSGLLFPSPGDLPDPGIEPVFSCFSRISMQILYHCATWEAVWNVKYISIKLL